MNAPASLNNNNNPSHPWPHPVIVTGPTGAGKSSFAVALAERLGGEIIGADAFQIYAGLPILTAQPSPDLLSRAPHHLIGVIPLGETCDAARYAAAARRCIEEISARGRIPILVGGTGLYIKALTHGLANLPPVDQTLRAEIAALDPAAALARLRESDPQAPAQIDSRNPARVRRALEIVLSTARPLSESRTTWVAPASVPSPENAATSSLSPPLPVPGAYRGIVFSRDRDELRQRIADNVEAQFASGVIEEVRMANSVGPTASRAIGFREIQSLLRGECDLAACKEAIIFSTCRYAKRQLTWCRNQFSFPAINAASPNLLDTALAAIEQSPSERIPSNPAFC